MLINTLSVLIVNAHLFSWLEMALFLIIVLMLIYYDTPPVKNVWPKLQGPGLYWVLRSCWFGQASLKQAFWPFFLFVNAILVYIDYRALNVTFTIASWKTAHGMLFLPMVWWMVSVWRCSSHTSRRLWAIGARTGVVLLFLEFFLRFVMSTWYPALFFDCRLLAIEFGDCD